MYSKYWHFKCQRHKFEQNFEKIIYSYIIPRKKVNKEEIILRFKKKPQYLLLITKKLEDFKSRLEYKKDIDKTIRLVAQAPSYRLLLI